MNAYLELKQKHQEEFNDFPMIFAFNNEQFEEGMKKLGLAVHEVDKIYRSGGGGFYKRTDSEKLKQLFLDQEVERTKAIKEDETGDGFIYQMFDFELGNHEYCITLDLKATLDALGFTIEQVNVDEVLKKGLKLAINNQIDFMEGA